MCQKVMKQRSNNPLFIIDIGVPRNVNPVSKKIENVFLYDIDSLSTIVDRNLEKRKAEIPKVHAIFRRSWWISSTGINRSRWGRRSRSFREALEAIRREEVEKNINRFRPEDRELVELVTKRIVNKILHQPTTALKQGAQNGSGGAEGPCAASVLRELFGIPAQARGNMKSRTVRIGSRGSDLALWQARWVQSELLRTSSRNCRSTIEIIKTTGDKILDAPLSKIGDKGLFTREIETALLEGRIDLAVHSLKDLPTELPEGLDDRCGLRAGGPA